MCNDRIWILLTRKLSGEATSTELKELDILLQADPQHHSTIETISDMWHNRTSPDEEFMEATFLAHLERTRDKGMLINVEGLEPGQSQAAPSDNSRLFIRWASIAAVVAILLLGASFFLNTKPSETQGLMADNKEVSTKNGSRTKMKLPDGTDVWLNAGSKLTYGENFDGKTREVNLTGEAFFDVVHNAEKPFIIHTSKIDVKVLGTQFNVKAYEGDKTTETSLIRGSVEVFLKKDPGKKYLLHPNEKLVLENEAFAKEETRTAQSTQQAGTSAMLTEPPVVIRQLSYYNEDQNVESSWTRNVLSFDDEQFSEVAKKLERWYDVTVNFKNKYWEKKHISGSFESESLEQAMEALKYSTGFSFKINQKTVTIY